MDIRPLSPSFAVSPQIDAADVAALAQAGYVAIICNRPDVEVPPSHQAATIEAAAKNAGLEFIYVPVTHQTLTQEVVDQVAAEMSRFAGPVFAYCASGTRSSIVWSYTQAGVQPTDAIIEATGNAGYDLGGMRAALDRMAGQS